MARTHRRSSSPDQNDSSTLIKKLKSSHVSTAAGGAATTNGHANGSATDPTSNFADGILAHTSIAQLNAGYASNGPFKYAIVEKLFQDDLLQKVKDECMSELNFTEKETDIYKVRALGISVVSRSWFQGQPNGRPCLVELSLVRANLTFTQPTHSPGRPLFPGIP